MRILLLTSELFTGSLLKTFLEEHDFVVDQISDHPKGLYRATCGLYDAIIYDENFEEHFPEKLVELQPKADIPIIVHLEKNIFETSLQLRKIGIQYIFNKPISPEETSYILRNLFTNPLQKRQHILQFEDLELNLLTRKVSRASRSLQLRTKELILLEYLLLHPHQVITRIRLLQHVWPNFTNILTNTVDSHVCALRKKVDGGFEKKLIETVHGVGYKIG